MHLELTNEQHELVLEILRSRQSELRQEIRHATVSKFAEQLKDTQMVLKSTIHELELAQPVSSGH